MPNIPDGAKGEPYWKASECGSEGDHVHFKVVDDVLVENTQADNRKSYAMRMESKGEIKKFPLNSTNLGRLSDVLGNGTDWTNAEFDVNIQTVTKPGGGAVLSFRVLSSTIQKGKKQAKTAK
jgi:hypothetical protein